MPTLTAERKALADLAVDPVAFARGALRFNPWSVQEDILRAMAKPRARVAVKACHASGKTAVAARAVLYHVTTYDDGIAVTTAPTTDQVERLLWGEIHRAAENARVAYPPLLQTELRFSANNYAMGRATNQGVRFQGFHGRVLIVVDEAPGVEPDIWEAIEGIRAAGDVRVLALGNPTIASGPFYDAFTSQRAAWQTFTISAMDTPNLAGLSLDDVVNRDQGDPFLLEGSRDWNKDLTSRMYVWEKYRDWGPGHPLWESRVLGNFPAQAEDALISLAWLEAARYREVTDTGAPIIGGLDVAGPGEDETALCLRQGDAILKLLHWAQSDPRGEVAAALAPYRGRVESLNVDSAGIGYYMGKHLQDLHYPVAMVNVGEAPGNREKYVNLKAELYWGLRMRFQEGGVAGLTDDTAIAQLTGVRYSHNARGQVVIEGKEQARKRGVKSPDRAEAIMLSFGPPKRWMIG